VSKYGSNHAVSSDGRVFPSKRECKRYEELLLLEKLGEITDLECQVKWPLIPKQEGERAVTWTSDFQYRDKAGAFHVEDSKGCKTQQYIIRRKLMLFFHGVRIEEV